jgi:hypothetical protein
MHPPDSLLTYQQQPILSQYHSQLVQQQPARHDRDYLPTNQPIDKFRVATMLPPSRPPFDPKWATALLCRDIKALKSKYIRKLKTSLSRKSTKTSSLNYQQPIPVEIPVPETHQHTVRDESEHSQMLPEVSQHTMSEEAPSTEYELLDAKLKVLYASRDRDMTHTQRWQFRGAWLVLYMAIQACPSSSSYDVLRDAETVGQVPTDTTSTSQVQVSTSQMPAELYSKPSESHKRYDSGVSTSFSGALLKARPTVAQMWHEIREAASDHKMLVRVAEELLGFAWPETSAKEVIEMVGHPGMRFADEDGLRERFRGLLFPEYDALVNGAHR